jgi:hypothetical protein
MKIEPQRIILIITANFLFFIYLVISNEREDRVVSI